MPLKLSATGLGPCVTRRLRLADGPDEIGQMVLARRSLHRFT